jgi:hypothetical protein
VYINVPDGFEDTKPSSSPSGFMDLICKLEMDIFRPSAAGRIR